MRYHRVVAAVLLASSVLAPALSATPVAADTGTRLIPNGGTAAFVSRPLGADAGVQNPEFALSPDDAHDAAAGPAAQQRSGAGPSLRGEAVRGIEVSGNDEGGTSATTKVSFNGLNFRQQRLANGGNQFSLEPPDQGLCVGNNFVVETINDVIRVFDLNGNPLTGVTDLNTFYGYAPAIIRATGTFGPFITDPSCWFDASTQRFFHVVLTLEVVPTGPKAGNFTGANHLDLAVSKTADPTAGWNIYRVAVQDDGSQGTPNHLCPPGSADRTERTNPNACLGDFPHIGADNSGFYVTTNEYCFFCPGLGFHGAQVYAFNKQALANGAANARVTQLDTAGAQSGKPGFTLWPATSPTAQDFALGARGTEYFTSSNAAEEASGVPNNLGTSNQIVVWALSNTSSLQTAAPDLSLRNTIVRVDRYSVPPPSNQKGGDFPLGQCVNDTTTPTIFGTVGCWTAFFNPPAPKHDETIGPLDSSDSRVLSTTFAGGKLYGTLDTGVTVGGKAKAGVLYYIIRPELDDGRVSADLKGQGHVAVANNNVIYGTVAATHRGQVVIGFTLVGDTHHPSQAYVALNSENRPSAVTIVAEGVGVQDGFSEYDAFSNPQDSPARPRWGDYGAAVATDNNTIWLANEYIAQSCTLAQYMAAPFGSCGGTRASLGNWATRVTSLDVRAIPEDGGGDD